MEFKGRTWKFGEDIDTDAIIPARYLNTSLPEELAKHCMEDADPEFPSKVKKGDIIVAGKNFGCGSSREHAPMAVKAAGVSCVIAVSFARIFYRNSINIGLPIFECEEADKILEGDIVEVDGDTGRVTDLTRNKVYHAMPYPDFMKEIINAGGLRSFVAERMKK